MSELAERVQRVRLLLDTLNDPYPTPRALLVPDSGPAPSRYVPCETCRERGELRQRGGWVLCLVCDGVGWKRREDEAPWDAYVGLPLADAAALPRQSSPARVQPIDGGEDSYAWERLRSRYDRHGSYADLRRQLDWLSLVNPRRYRLVRSVAVDHEPRELNALAVLDLDLGIVMLTLRMQSVRVPGWLIEQTTADLRASSIEGLAREGLKAGEIARRMGMSKGAVVRKLKRKGLDSGGAGIPRGAMRGA